MAGNKEQTTNFEREKTTQIINVVSRGVLVGEIRKLYEKPNPAIFILLGGDRIACCDEGVIMQEGDSLVGVATIAPYGEENSGQPTIVGLYVVPEYRSKGYGKQILQKAIERCLERGFEKIRMDVMSSDATEIIKKLPKEIQEKLDVRYMGNMMDNF